MCDTDDLLTNSQYFQKYRLNNEKPPTDRKLACQGRLVESSRHPRAFYNGWYPVRECSFPGHESKPGAGHTTFKDQSFRNHKVICNICDHPDNIAPAPPKLDECCEDFECPLSVVGAEFCNDNMMWSIQPAPKGCDFPKCEPAEKETQCKPINGDSIPNTHWRYHDPGSIEKCPQLPADARVHHYNWFRTQMDNDNKHALKRKAESIRDCVDKYTKNNPISKAEFFDV